MTDFDIGTNFFNGGKHKKLCTVSDVLKTYNSRGELVKTSYTAIHLFMGQAVTEHNICKVTIQRGLVQ